jgi:hypothetical protein
MSGRLRSRCPSWVHLQALRAATCVGRLKGRRDRTSSTTRGSSATHVGTAASAVHAAIGVEVTAVQNTWWAGGPSEDAAR